MSRSVETSNPPGGVPNRREPTQPSLHDSLMERILDRANMQRAWKRVQANKGAPGIDAMSVEEFPAFARDHWPGIRQALFDGTYQPSAVRRVDIPKRGGRGTRPLGIPTVVDRLICQAIAQVLTPIFDPDFSASSFGFRPGRSAHDCMNYFGISEYYRPVPALDHWIRRRIRMCYWKQWRYARTKVRHLLELGTSKRQAILTAIRRKGYWHLSKTLATQTGMTNQWLASQGLLSVRDLWIKAHGYS